MSSALRSLLLLSTLALASPARAAGGEGWIADFDAAVAAARKEQKDLLVDFTGSDWCGWCIRLSNEVFSKPEFLDAAKKEYVLVALDFPRSPEAVAKVPNRKRNEELRDKYRIGGYPTILLMTADGDVFGSTGYKAGGPVKYVEHLTELRTSGRKQLLEVLELVKSYETATGADKDAVFERMAAALEASDGSNATLQRLIAPVRAAMEADADNRKGHKLRAIGALLAVGEAGPQIIAGARELDPKNERGVLERALLVQFRSSDEDTLDDVLASFEQLEAVAPIKDKRVAVELYAYSAVAASQLSDLPKAKKFAQKAKDIGSDNARLIAAMDQILGS